MSITVRRTALLAVLFMAACAPAGEPIIAPLPQGAALDTAGRPYVRTAVPSEAFQAALAQDTRSETGAPGEDYWQQDVRYDIRATLDPRERRITGAERVVYRNNAPRELPYVIFNLYQNLFTESRVGRTSPLNTGGYDLTAFSVNGVPLQTLTQAQYEADQRAGRPSVGYITTGTLSRVLLPEPLATGDSAVFEISWTFIVPPGTQAPRTGWEDELGGRVFQVAQWYPQIAVYDDVVGYDVTPYSGQGEFYLEYGEYDVALTLPAGWTVGATGVLENPEILRPEVRQRLAAALASDTTVRVLTAAERGATGATGAGDGGLVTWRFSAENVRDFGWATSDQYVWDARTAEIPAPGAGARPVLINSLYRPGAPHWDESALFGEHATEELSQAMVPYAYPQLTIAEGPIFGMEYPMLVFIGRPTDRLDLYEVIAHEIGHQWHPMMVGQDEAAFAWMDEGLATFGEALAVQDFFPDFDPWEEPRDVYLSIAGDKGEAPLNRNIELVFGPANVVSGYFKPGTLMRTLRRVLGDETFFEGLRTFQREWMFKHPYPWDFFNTFERVAGRDLDWFWYPFWYRTVTLDQELASVTPTEGGVQVTVRDLGQAPAPAEVVVTTADGRTTTEVIPIERWLNPGTRSVTTTIPVTGTVTRVEIDPGLYYPDVDRRNNVWTAR